MLNDRQKLGRDAEKLAERMLVREGYRIVAKNYRVRSGEIDIIAEERGTLAFIEVKARRSGRYGDPREAVNFAKQKKISRVALCYLKATGQENVNARFDVVSVNYRQNGPEVEIIRDAFEFIQ